MLPDRFWDKVIPEPNSGCWLWMAASVSGYGYYRITTDKNILAHRASYEDAKGPVPEGLELDHLCRVRCCVNPDHLDPVTRSENIKRGINAQNGMFDYYKRKRFKATCVNGHLFEGKNAHFKKDGRRRCGECARLYAKKVRLKRSGRVG